MFHAKSGLQILHSTLVLALLGAVLIQIIVQAKKYVDSQTTVSKTSYQPGKLLFPSMTFCPGFRRDELKKYPWLSWEHAIYTPFQGNMTFPQNRSEAQDIWDSINFDLDDILIAGSWWSGTSLVVWHSSLDISQNTSRCLRVKKYRTLSGNCFTITSPCPVTLLEGFTLYLNLSQTHRRELDVMFHPPRSQLGMNENFWPSPVGIEKLVPGTGTSVLIKKYMQKQEQGSSEEKYFDCIDTSLSSDIVSAILKDSYCHFPSHDSILEHALGIMRNLTSCTDANSFTFSTNTHMYRNLFKWHRSLTCGTMREQIGYTTTSKLSSNIVSETMSALYVSYETTEVIVEEEYTLVDFPTLLAAAGGFVGMILGWSVLDFVEIVFKYSRKNMCDEDKT